ncbi:GTPase-activating protein gyp8 [Lecanora helva]
MEHKLLEKRIAIVDACEAPVNLGSLVTLATSAHGLVDDELRCNAWPHLLGYDRRTVFAKSQPSWQDLPVHKDESQVELDVNRSFIYYPKNESERQLDRRKEELLSVIIQVLREHPMLCYFQGFHDIVQVFLLVLGAEQAPEAVAHLSLLRIRDFMLPSLAPSLGHLNLLPSILQVEDVELYRHLSQTQPFFALAATLTLYAHDIQEYGVIARLFDFLIAQPAVVSIYLFAVIILSRREELFEIPADEPEMLHSTLSKLPKPLDLELLISRTMTLFREHPPEELPARTWSKIPRNSVLKTTRALGRDQSLQDGEGFFEMQALQIRRQDLRQKAIMNLWKYRRPVGGFGLAVLVGLISIWLGRKGLESAPAFGLRRVKELFGFFR